MPGTGLYPGSSLVWLLIDLDKTLAGLQFLNCYGYSKCITDFQSSIYVFERQNDRVGRAEEKKTFLSVTSLPV